jgi:hypothetical protein
LPDYLQFWLLLAAGAVVLIPITLLTPAEPMDHLVRYYVMTRPLGWWGPVHREAVRRGLIHEEGASDRVGSRDPSSPSDTGARRASRPLLRRQWTAAEAEQWTREDWIVIVLSPLVLGALMIGVTWTLLLRPAGFVVLVAALLGIVFLYWLIDPKLRAASSRYALHQESYIAQNEALTLEQHGASPEAGG